MTLPISYKLPEIDKAQTPEQMTSYLQDLNYELQNMYGMMTQNINGFIRSSEDVDGSEWKPTVRGNTVNGTFTYAKQAGYSVRQGIMTELFFDIEWTASGGASGYLILELPYKVIKAAGLLFTGALFTSNLAYPAGFDNVVISAQQNSFNAFVIKYGSSVVASNLDVGPVGRIAGSLRYIGVEDE